MVPGATGSSATGVAAAAPAGFMYFAGSAANLALEPALQKYTGLPSCSRTCGDCRVPVIPQTGSLSCTGSPVAGVAAAFMEQQRPASIGAGATTALDWEHPQPPRTGAAELD